MSDLGVMRIGETLLPIKSIHLGEGCFLIEAEIQGPVTADSGGPIMYTREGQVALIGATQHEVPEMKAADRLTITYKLNIDYIKPGGTPAWTMPTGGKR